MKSLYAALERAVAKDDKAAVKRALAKLSDYDKDLLVDCKTCKAGERKPCVGLPEGRAHVARRLIRLLEGIR